MSQHITVLLAAYNGASYIEEQIRSILGQTLPPDQLLISDDGSTDGTVELLERLQAEWLLINGKAIIRIGGIRFRLLP